MRQTLSIRMPHGLEIARLSGSPGRAARVRGSEWHCHARHELLVILRGEYRVRTGGTSHRLRVGDAIYYPRGCRHAPVFGPEASREMLRFAWTAPDLGVSVATRLSDAAGHLAFLLDWAVAVSQDPETYPSLILRANAVLDYLRDCLRRQPRTQTDHLLLHMDTLLPGGPAVQATADAAGVSRSQLTRNFRRQLGVTPRDVVIRKRMEKARGLLATTDMTVKEVAREIGYRTPQHLAARFRAHFGMNPTTYRDTSRGLRRRA